MHQETHPNSATMLVLFGGSAIILTLPPVFSFNTVSKYETWFWRHIKWGGKWRAETRCYTIRWLFATYPNSHSLFKTRKSWKTHCPYFTVTNQFQIMRFPIQESLIDFLSTQESLLFLTYVCHPYDACSRPHISVSWGLHNEWVRDTGGWPWFTFICRNHHRCIPVQIQHWINIIPNGFKTCALAPTGSWKFLHKCHLVPPVCIHLTPLLFSMYSISHQNSRTSD